MKKQLLLLLMIASNLIVCAQNIPNYVSTNGLIGWWPFNGNANDESGSANNGTISGAALTSDRFGSANAAYSFNGSNDVIRISSNFFNVGWTGYTISGWYMSTSASNPNNGNNSQTILNTTPHNGIGTSMNWGGNNKHMIAFGSYPPNNSWDIFSSGAVSSKAILGPINNWTHYVIVKSNGNKYSLYLNGVLDTSYVAPNYTQSYSCSINLGNIDASIIQKEGFMGKLDDFGMWNRDLSSNEISQLYYGPNVGIAKEKEEGQLIIYPNPTTDQIVFETNENQVTTFDYSITDVLGQQVVSGKITKSEIIDTKQLGNGIYFFTINNLGHKSIKFIKE